MHISIRTKLLALVTVSLTLGVGLVVFNAVRLFSKDSADSLYLNADLLTAAKAREAREWLDSLERRVVMTAKDEKEILIRQSPASMTVSTAATVRMGLSERDVIRWWNSLRDKQHLVTENVPSGEPVLIWNKNGFQAAILLDRLMDGFQEAGPYQLSLVRAEKRSHHKGTKSVGRTLASASPEEVVSHADVGEIPIVNRFLESPLDREFQEYQYGGQTWLGAYAKLGIENLAVVSRVPASRAYESSRLLVQRSLWIAIFVLSAVFLIATFFVEGIVTPIGALRATALEVSHGNFKTRVHVGTQAGTKDEMFDLAHSFNLMSAEIERLLVQTADKARMEKELETARHVQNNMFPPASVQADTFEIESYYRPAAECGGDWWGFLELPNGKLILAIGDATGHGVPSAMVTATAKATFSVLNLFARTKLDIASTPKLMMQIINRAIFESTRGQVLMTFFLAVFDTTTGVIEYCSASHDPIYWGKKDGWDVLQVNPGPRLGISTAAKFEQARAEIGVDDLIVLYTDGIPEAKNPALEEWGDRRMLRTLRDLSKGSVGQVRDGLIQKLETFMGGEPLHDDVTLAVLRRKQRDSL